MTFGLFVTVLLVVLLLISVKVLVPAEPIPAFGGVAAGFGMQWDGVTANFGKLASDVGKAIEGVFSANK